MRFLSIYKARERGVPPSPEEMAKMGKLIEEGMKQGHLLATEGCMPSVTGARVRLANGTVSVTDGPFTESKEVIGGLAILKANSKAEAVELAKAFGSENSSKFVNGVLGTVLRNITGEPAPEKPAKEPKT